MNHLLFFNNYISESVDSKPLNGMMANHLLKDSDAFPFNKKEIEWVKSNINTKDFDLNIDKENSFFIFSKSKTHGTRVWKLKDKWDNSDVYFLKLKANFDEHHPSDPSSGTWFGSSFGREWGRNWEKFNTENISEIF
jgi:hypothetical protein